MKDTFLAKTSLLLSLGFWVPLFNLGLCLLSLILAIKALRQVNQDSQKYGGVVYASIAIIISSSAIIFTVIFFAVYLQRKLTCENIALLDLI